MRVITNTNIEHLYLHKNQINNFDLCLKILYKTKKVYDQEEEKKNNIDNPPLYNIDLSLNDCLNKNIEQIELLEKIIDDTTLSSIDLSRTLFNSNINDILIKDDNNLNDYEKRVFKLKKSLDNKQREYDRNKGKLKNYKVYKEKIQNLRKEDFIIFDKEISNIIKDDDSIYPIFLKEKARMLIKKNNNMLGNISKKEKEKKLVEYMILKIYEENIKNLKDKIEEYKLILI